MRQVVFLWLTLLFPLHHEHALSDKKVFRRLALAVSAQRGGWGRRPMAIKTELSRWFAWNPPAVEHTLDVSITYVKVSSSSDKRLSRYPCFNATVNTNTYFQRKWAQEWVLRLLNLQLQLKRCSRLERFSEKVFLFSKRARLPVALQKFTTLAL
jgi:hypothetical protein